MDFTLNRTWHIFYNYIPVYEKWIQNTNLFRRYQTETIFQSWKKGHNSHNNWWILPLIELDLHFMIIYLCIKFEFGTLIFSKDIKQKSFLLHRRDGHTYGLGWYYMLPPHPTFENCGGIKKKPYLELCLLNPTRSLPPTTYLSYEYSCPHINNSCAKFWNKFMAKMLYKTELFSK